MSSDTPSDRCVALSLVTLLSWHYCREKNIDPFLLPYLDAPSVEMIYSMGKSSMRDKESKGITCLDVLSFGKKHGYCSNEEYRKLSTEPFPYLSSGKFVIKNFERLKNSTEVKEALDKFGPCLVVFPCYNDSCHFWKPSRDQLLQVYLRKLAKQGVDLSEQKLDDDLELETKLTAISLPCTMYHCLLVTDYVDKKFVLTNCWGATWCLGGTTKIEFAEFEKHIVEAWSVVVR